jgi:hypothetical protein
MCADVFSEIVNHDETNRDLIAPYKVVIGEERCDDAYCPVHSLRSPSIVGMGHVVTNEKKKSTASRQNPPPPPHPMSNQ